MARWILAAIVLAAASGCDQMTAKFDEQKIKAEKRWYSARSRVLYRLAENRFAGGELDSARKSVEQALVMDPQFTEAELLLARIQIEEGQYASALAALRKAAEGDPNSSETVYLVGVAQEKTGKLDDALASYRRAYALDEQNMSAVKATAEVLVAKGDIRQAQIYVDSFLPKADEDPGMHELAGRLAMMQKEYAKAAKHYEYASDLDYKNVRYQEELGRAHYSAGQLERAADTLSALVAVKDYKAPTWVYMMLGDCRLSRGRARQAFEAYYSASERSPESPAVWTGVAKSALAMGDAPRAILAARKALQLAPGDMDATLLLGYALLRSGQASSAVQTLTRAASDHPDNSMIHCVLGRAHAARGGLAAAIRCYTEALRVDPRNSVARALLEAAGREQLSKAN